MVETPIQIAYPSESNPHLRIALGACRFVAGAGEGREWVAGTYSDPTDRRPLTIETGASDFDLDLGGVPLSHLMVRQGAGKFELDFPQPNPEPMELLEISCGAAAIELENLANANFSEMRLSGGAASYELDFGGVLSRDAEVSIETGISGVVVSVPSSTATRVVAETTLGSVDVGDGFTKSEGAFSTGAALRGDGPVLRIRAGVRLGSLQLRTT